MTLFIFDVFIDNVFLRLSVCVAFFIFVQNLKVTSYLPYQKGVYFPSTADKEKISVGAERQRRYRTVVAFYLYYLIDICILEVHTVLPYVKVWWLI